MRAQFKLDPIPSSTKIKDVLLTKSINKSSNQIGFFLGRVDFGQNRERTQQLKFRSIFLEDLNMESSSNPDHRQ